METNKKQLLDTFQSHLYQEYLYYCHQQRCAPHITGLITYLIDRDLLSKKVIKSYTIQREFKNLYPTYEHHKTRTVMALADRFNISERSVWSSIKSKQPIPMPSKAY